jgi:phage tail sheath protein FI
MAPPQPIELPPRFTLNDISRVQQALVVHCEMMQFRFAILDTPDFGYPKLRVDLGEVQSWRQRFDTEFAALYYPWIFVSDPLQSDNQPVRRIPPSGHVAGVYAHTDLTEGVFKAPANSALLWAQSLTTNVLANQQSFLNPIAVDCLRIFPGRGIRVYGARTLSSQPAWRFVSVRRLVSMIEKALLISLQWAVFEPNNQNLWNQIKASASGFLDVLWSRGALAGNTAEEAFYVKCDADNNPLATTANGQLNIEIGVAPAIPAEFIVFRIGRTEDALQVSE